MSIEQIETGSAIERTSRVHRPEQIRIVSWNIDRGHRVEAVTEFLAHASADLILLQEVDRNCRRTGNRNVAKELSQRLQMNYVFGAEFQELAHGSRNSPAYHGQATLSPWPLLHPRVLSFQNQSTFWNPSWWIPTLAPFQRRLGGRMALVTDVCIGGIRLTAYNLHLESRNGDDLRVSQLRELLDDAGQTDLACPVIVGGDFNFDVGQSPQSVAISDSGFKNPFTGQSQTTVVNPNGRQLAIDCIVVRGTFHTVAANVHSHITASDHYPLSLTLLLEERGG